MEKEKKLRISTVVADLKENAVSAKDFDVYEQERLIFLRELQGGDMTFDQAQARSSELKLPTESYRTRSAWELYKCLRCSGHDRVEAYRLVRHEQAHAREAKKRGYDPYFEVFFTRADEGDYQMYLQTAYVVLSQHKESIAEDIVAIVSAPPTLSPDDKRMLSAKD